MAIKISIGRLKLAQPFAELVEREVPNNSMELLGIRPNHLEVLTNLPFHHRDPFDRLIVAQSMTEDLTIVSKDAVFGEYPVKLVWSNERDTR